MRVHILDVNHHLKFQSIFDSFFDDNVWTDQDPDFIVSFEALIHGDRRIELTPGRELSDIYEYLETLTPSRTEWGTLLGVRPLKLVYRLFDQGWTEQQVREHLRQHLLLQPQKIELLLEVAANQEGLNIAHTDKLSLFVSIPFCPTICSYCNFHTKPYQAGLAASYVESLLEELADLKPMLAQDGRLIDVVYLGGGTPTALPPELLQEIMAAIEDIAPQEQVIEYTIEAGRIDTFSPEQIELLEQVDRICINPQSFNPRILRGVNRKPFDGMTELVRHFEDRGVIVNSDLIAGLPEESLASFQASLEQLIEQSPSNITIHNLSIKRGSELRGNPLSEAGVRDMLRTGYTMLKAANYMPYYLYRQKNMLANGENVGYAKPGKACIYNIRMMEDNHDILSIGSNAVSKRITAKGLERIPSIKEATLYMTEKERWRDDLARFFAPRSMND